jgi:hypothetical protein
VIVKPQTVIIREMLESLNQAIGGASQLIHHLQEPRLMHVRQALEITRDACAELAPKGLRFKPREKKIIVPMKSTV